MVDELRERWGDRVAGLEPGSNQDAADAELVVLATVWDAAVSTARAHADQLAGKIVISMANGLEKRGRQFVPVPSPAGSIAAEVKAAAPAAYVVAAFHLVPAAALADLELTRSPATSWSSATRKVARPCSTSWTPSPTCGPSTPAPSRTRSGIETFSAALLTVNLRHKGEGSLRIEGVGPRRTT